MFGNATFVLPKGHTLRNQYAIETLVRQISVALLRRQAEEQVREAHDKLEELVRERTRELEETNEKLKLEIEEQKQTKEGLRASEERYRFLTENMLDMVWILGRDFRTTYVSPSIEKVLGFTPEERKQQSIEEAVTPESLQKIQGRFMEELQRDKEDGVELDRSVIIEVEYYHKDGSTVWMENRVQAIRDAEKAIVGMMGVSRDITERRKAHREWENIFQAIGHPTLILDDSHCMIHANNAAETATGRPREDLMGKKCHEIFHNTDEAPEGCPFEMMLITGHLETVEMEMEALNGTFLVSCTPMLDHEGRLEKVIHIATDITDRKRAEEALQASEERHRMMIEHMNSGVAVYETKDDGASFVFRDFNPAAERISKIKKKEVIGKELLELFPKMNRFGLVDALRRVWKTGKAERLHAGYYRDDRRQGWRDNRIYKLPSGEVVAIYDDVTAQKETELKLAESEKRLRTVLETVALVAIMLDTKGSLTFCNDFFLDLTGWKREEALGKDWFDTFIPAEIEGGLKREVFLNTIKTGEFPAHYENEIITKSGERRLIAWNNTVFFNEEGEVFGTTSIGEDITDRRNAEEQLRKSEAFVNDVIRSINDGVFVLNDRFQYMVWNPAMEAISEVPKENVIRRNEKPWELFPHLKEVGIDQVMHRAMAGETIVNQEVPYYLPSGRSGFTSESYFPLTDLNGAVSGVIGVIREITVQKALEHRLRQGQKMEAVGTLAGGIAHEFNNALMGIMGSIELLKMDLPEDKGRDKYFEAMKSSGYRMSRLTDQLLAYAQGGKYQAKNLRLDEFVIETLPILQHDLSTEVRVKTYFPKDLSYVNADHTQMQMILSAILANSNEAIEDKGLIKITARDEIFDKSFAEKHAGLKPGPYVCLTIQDDGKGMNEEEREKIFDPFFTTKFQGRGMGMAAVYGIVKNHDGWIFVDSKLGKGTLVRIYLPAVEAEVRKDEKPKVEPVKGTGTILVIEDEDVVIEVTQTMLERLGYRVMVARTGKDAIYITETFDGDIDLALLDIKLPDMDGGKIYPLIMKSRPNLKVVVFSGYSIEGPARKILDAGAQGFIQKPFSLMTLSEKVKRVLEGG